MKKYTTILLILSFFILLSGCSSDDDTPETLDTPIGDISGTWAIAETTTSANSVCSDEVGMNYDYFISVAQNGNDITVSLTGAGPFSGKIDGNKIRWSGSYDEDGGITTVNWSDITIASDCNSLSGSSTWSWTDNFDSCSGTTSIQGTRDPADGC